MGIRLLRFEHPDIEGKYPTMAVEELCSLKVPVAKDAILFLWGNPPKLHDTWGLKSGGRVHIDIGCGGLSSNAGSIPGPMFYRLKKKEGLPGM